MMKYLYELGNYTKRNKFKDLSTLMDNFTRHMTSKYGQGAKNTLNQFKSRIIKDSGKFAKYIGSGLQTATKEVAKKAVQKGTGAGALGMLKTGAKTAGKVLKGGAGIAGAAIMPSISTYNAVSNWNAPGSNAASRALDAAGAAGNIGTTLIGGALGGIPGAGVGSLVGIPLGAINQSAAQKVREANVNLQKPIVKNKSQQTKTSSSSAKVGSSNSGAPVTQGVAANTTPSYNPNAIISGNDQIKQMIIDEAKRQGLDPALALTVAQIESGFNPNARSGAGAIGVMQLMPATAKGLGVDPYNVQDNIRGGVKYLKTQMDAHNNSVNKALAAYNAGPGAVARHGGVPPYAETQNYVAKAGPILAAYKGEGYSNGSMPMSQDNTRIVQSMQNNEPIGQGRILTGGIMQNVDANGNPVQVTGAAAYSGQPGAPLTYNPYTPRYDYNMTPQEAQMIQQAMTPQGAVTSQDMLGLLQDRYQQIRDINAQNPYYQGQVVNPSNPEAFNISPGDLRMAMAKDQAAQWYGVPNMGGNVDRLMREAQILQQAEIQRQTGVPYQDYIRGMTERQKADILAAQQEVEKALKIQAQQTDDIAKKMEIMQKIYDTRVNAQKDIDKVNAEGYAAIQKQVVANQGDYNVADITGRYAIAKQNVANAGDRDVANINANTNLYTTKMKLDDPYYQLKAQGDYWGNVGFNPNMPGIMRTTSPQTQEALFGGQLTPEQMQQTFGGAIPQQGGNNQTSLAQRLWAKIEGLQANEQ